MESDERLVHNDTTPNRNLNPQGIPADDIEVTIPNNTYAYIHRCMMCDRQHTIIYIRAGGSRGAMPWGVPQGGPRRGHRNVVAWGEL